MIIEPISITIKDIYKGYTNKDEEGVSGYDDKLNIRPPYQREFIYNSKQCEAVINTVMQNRPLNVMYWVKTDNGDYEVMDGQQRTLAVCEYINGNYAVNHRFFHNLTKDEKKRMLDYNLMVYVCDGADDEKLEWFKTINIAGVKLTNQELRNAVYAGSWLMDAKRHFSKTKCPAWDLGKAYLKGTPIRQDYLETVLSWISDNNIEMYMAEHQHDKDALDLWTYFQRVIKWVEVLFTNYRKEMKGLPWGSLYNELKDNRYDPDTLEDEVSQLMMDDEIKKKSGIYLYLLKGDEKYLNLRTFTNAQKRSKYEEQEGYCAICTEHFDIDEMEADHIRPWSEGGKTELDNCQMLCKDCNRAKSNK